MDMLETVVWVVAGFMVVAAVPAVIYFLLPPACLEIAERHGRYAGLGGRGKRSEEESEKEPRA